MNLSSQSECLARMPDVAPARSATLYPAMYGDVLVYAFEALACLFGALMAFVSYMMLSR